MKLSAKRAGDAVVVEFSGTRLEAAQADEFKKKLIYLIDRNCRKIALDISSVTFIDSTGLGVLVSALKLVGGEGDLVLAGVGDSVMKVLKLTRMDRVFKIYPDVRSAVRAFSG
jgi:anti-sigma B factor antagonist